MASRNWPRLCTRPSRSTSSYATSRYSSIKTPISPSIPIEASTPREQAIVIAAHCRPGGDADLRQITQWQLPLTACRDRDTPERPKVATEIALIANVYPITLLPEHDRADVVAPDGILDHFLCIFHADTIARQALAVPLQIQEVAFGRALRQHRARPLNRAHH